MASPTVQKMGNFAPARHLVGKDVAISAPASYRPLLDAAGYMSQHVSDFAEVRQCVFTGHKALHATRPIVSGEALQEFSARTIVTEPNYLTVQISDTQHIMLGPEWLQYVNHSCSPNVFFNTSACQLEAIQDIKAGEELRFFYCSTEWLMESPFDCCCGSAGCIGYVAGASKTSPEILSKYRLSEFIMQKLHDAAAV